MLGRTTTALFALATCLTLSLVGLGTARADQIFVRVQGQLTGVFSYWYNPVDELGGISLTEYGQVEDLAWSVSSPRDAASGLPTGKRQHRPLTLRVRMAGATSLVAQALTANQNLPSVRVLWFTRDDAASSYEQTRALVLTNANISNLSIYSAREQGELATYAEFSMTYQQIGIEDYEGGLSYSDSWESPVF